MISLIATSTYRIDAAPCHSSDEPLRFVATLGGAAVCDTGQKAAFCPVSRHVSGILMLIMPRAY